MTDSQFLAWVHERLRNVYGEDPLQAHLHRLRAIAASLPSTRNTETSERLNVLFEKLKRRID